MIEYRDEFKGSCSVLFTKRELDAISGNPFTRGLYITCIGYYPKAMGHTKYRERGDSSFILIYNVAGTGYIKTDTEKIKLLKNQFIILPPDKRHKYWSSEKDPWSIYWLHFTGSNSKLYYPYTFKAKTITHEEARINLFNELINLLSFKMVQYVIKYVTLTFPHLLASFVFDQAFRQSKHLLVIDSVIDKSILFMKEHLYEDISLPEFAESVNLSVSQYSKYFRSEIGISPMQYFIDLKMKHAAFLLQEEGIRINEVAFKMGYTDPFYFSRLFKKIMGRSPKKYMKGKKYSRKNAK